MRRYALVVALAAVATIVSVALAVAPRVHVGGAALEAIVFGGAALTSIGAVHLASAGTLRTRAALALGACSALLLLAFAAFPPRHVALGVVIDVAIVALAHSIGASIGRRVEDAGHLLPAAIVASCADVVSVLHPRGPTHLLLENESALGVAAFAFPIPGFRALAPALGIGDLVFVALVLGVAHAKHLPHARVALAALAGALASGVLSAALGAPVPALPAIGAGVLLSTPAFVRLRSKDRTVALGAIVIALVVAALVVANRFLG